MIPFLALLLMCLAGAVGLACAINYFFQLGARRSATYSLFAIAVIFLFALSGLWQNSSRHDWGILAPVFALMLICGWAALRFGWPLIKHVLKKKRGQ